MVNATMPKNPSAPFATLREVSRTSSLTTETSPRSSKWRPRCARLRRWTLWVTWPAVLLTISIIDRHRQLCRAHAGYYRSRPSAVSQHPGNTQSQDSRGRLDRQLLAFSRKQMQSLRVLNLNKVVQDICRVLPRLIGEDVEVSFVAGQD